MTSAQEARNDFLQTEITRLDAQIKDIANLRAEIEALKARQKAVEDLQTDRNMPVHLLNELVKQTPEGVYLTAIKQTGQVVAVTGVAQTNERVSEFLRNTLYNSPWLERPELVEIKAVTLTAANREQRRLFEFSMRVTLKRPQAAAPLPPVPLRRRAAAGGSARQTILRCDMAKASTLNFDVTHAARPGGGAVPQPQHQASRASGRRCPRLPPGWPLARGRGGGRLVCPADRRHRRARGRAPAGAAAAGHATATSWRRPSTWASCASRSCRCRST